MLPWIDDYQLVLFLGRRGVNCLIVIVVVRSRHVEHLNVIKEHHQHPSAAATITIILM